MEIIMIHNLIDPATGQSYKEGNLKVQHQIPVGTLVEVKFDRWFGDGACEKVHARLWVVAQRRDCDGTPLYSISEWKDPAFAMPDKAHHGFIEESLVPMEITPEIQEGKGVLKWSSE